MVDGVDAARSTASLTERETEVAQLLAAGQTNAQIAENLGVTFATAKWHVSQVLSKLGIDRREEVAALLAESGREPYRVPSRFSWNLIPTLRVLGVFAAAVPIAAVGIAAVVILRSLPDDTQSLTSDTVSAVSSTAPANALIIATPTRESLASPTAAPSCVPALGPPQGNVEPANHSGCDFTGFDFGAAYLNQANLSGATLTDAVFTGATLGRADLSSAVARGVKFHSAILQGTKFDGADLTGADFTDSIATGATFHGATCPDGLPASTRGDTCIGTPGLKNLPTTRSLAAARALEGSPAPSFAIPDATRTGAQLSLNQFTGRRVVLWWFASWCGPCETELTELRRATETDPDTVFLPLSLDVGTTAAGMFLTSGGFDGPWGVDADRVVATAYGVIGLPTVVVIDERGYFVSSEVGWSAAALADFLTRTGVLP